MDELHPVCGSDQSPEEERALRLLARLLVRAHLADRLTAPDAPGGQNPASNHTTLSEVEHG
jgi:hypothetical protein